jgi:tetratricopeptide (TPR) repeat protein
MVQRQRSDPGGASLGAGQEPDAPVTMVKSEEDAYLVSEIVVDPIDTRHVVDEIRDNTSSSRDPQREPSTVLTELIDLTKKVEAAITPTPLVEVPRASWFDVFDWKNIEPDTEREVLEQNPPAKEEQPVIVESEEVPFDQGVEVPILDRLISPGVISPSAARAVSPRPDRSVGRRVRDAIKSKTVVTSRDVLMSRFERDIGRSPRVALTKAETVTPVVASNDVPSNVERFGRPSSVALSKLFHRESNAPPPKLISEEFTSDSVVSASELRGKPYSRTPNAPRLLSEEFTADSIVSTSELQSMYFAPPSPQASNRLDSVTRVVDVTLKPEVLSVPPPPPLVNKETSLLDDLYSTWSEKGDTSSPEEQRAEPETVEPKPEPTVEALEDPLPTVENLVENCEALEDDIIAVEETPNVECTDDPGDVTPGKIAPESDSTEKNEVTEQIELKEGIDNPTHEPDPCTCLGLDGACENETAAEEDPAKPEEESRSFTWFGNKDESVVETPTTREPMAELTDSAPEAMESASCTMAPHNMLESFFACIDPTYEEEKAHFSTADTTEPLALPEQKESSEARTGLNIDTTSPQSSHEPSNADADPTSSTNPCAVSSPLGTANPIGPSATSPLAATSPIVTTSPNGASVASPYTSPRALSEPSPSANHVIVASPKGEDLPKESSPTSSITSPILDVATSIANGLSPMFTSKSPKPVESPLPSPTRSLTQRETNVAYDTAVVRDDESIGGNLLDNDLDSVPSVAEDVEDSVAPMQAEDLGPPNRPNTNSATLVESKVKKMKLPAEQMAANLDDASTCSTAIGASEKPKIDPSLDARRRLLIKELRSNIATFGRYDVRCANISAALGDLLDEAKDYDHALKLHKDAVTIYSCKLGDDHTTTMDARVRLGAVLENAGEIEEAINNYYQVTVMRRALRGDQDPSVGDGLVCMANALRKKGDYDQAIKELKRALKVFRESLGDSHTKVAATVDEIASLYVTIGNFDKSAAILEEVVKLKAATMGVKSKAVAATLGQLATAYECSEKFTEAMKALKKSYKIYTEIGGYSNEDATATLNRMAQLYEATKDHNRAAVAYLGVLRGRKIQRGADHLSVGETYFRLGRALRETKQFDKALKCHKEALPIFVGQGVEMNDVKMVAEIMHEMALISQDRGHFEDATRIFKQELSVRRKIGQSEFPFATRTLKHLGINEYNLKNYSRALKHLVEALTIYKEHGDQGVECGEILFHTGLVFRKVGNDDRAKEAFVEAVRIFNDHSVDQNDSLLREANENIKSIEAGIM